MKLELPGGDVGAVEFLRLFEQEFRIGMFIWTIEPERIQWSNRMFEMFGLTPRSVEPSFALLQTLTHEEDRRTPASLRFAIGDGRLLNREFRVIWPSGEIRWLAVRARTITQKSGNPEKIIGACIDITEKKMALASVELGERRRRALVQAAGGVGWLARADGAIMDVENTGAQRSPGVTPWGEGWLSWLHPDDRDDALTNWKKAVADKIPYVNEFRAMRPDGTFHWNRATAIPLRDKAGEVLEWVGISFDLEEPAERGGTQDDAPALTGAQIRGARGMLNWSVRDLADAAKVSPATLRRLEEFDGPAPCPKDTLLSISHALSKGGVEFVRMPHGKPAIRPR
jgi:PAS domain S-box-containing protein